MKILFLAVLLISSTVMAQNFNDDDDTDYSARRPDKMVVPQGPTTYNQVGNTIYDNHGNSYNQVGNTTYGSNGHSCTTVGTYTYCN